MPQLIVVGFATGVGTVLHLVEGNAMLELVRATTQIDGPSVAGGLIQLLTAPDRDRGRRGELRGIGALPGSDP